MQGKKTFKFLEGRTFIDRTPKFPMEGSKRDTKLEYCLYVHFVSRQLKFVNGLIGHIAPHLNPDFRSIEDSRHTLCRSWLFAVLSNFWLINGQYGSGLQYRLQVTVPPDIRFLESVISIFISKGVTELYLLAIENNFFWGPSCKKQWIFQYNF